MIYLELKEISSPIRFKEFVGHSILIRPVYSAKFDNIRLGTVSDAAVSDVFDVDTATLHRNVVIFDRTIVPDLIKLLASDEDNGYASGKVTEYVTANAIVVRVLCEDVSQKEHEEIVGHAAILGWEAPIDLSVGAGRLLRIARERNGTSVRTLAAILGISTGDLERIEEGELPVTFAQTVKIAKYLNISVSALSPVPIS